MGQIRDLAGGFRRNQDLEKVKQHLHLLVLVVWLAKRCTVRKLHKPRPRRSDLLGHLAIDRQTDRRNPVQRREGSSGFSVARRTIAAVVASLNTGRSPGLRLVIGFRCVVSMYPRSVPLLEGHYLLSDGLNCGSALFSPNRGEDAMKRWWALLLCLVLTGAVALGAACGDDDDDDNADAAFNAGECDDFCAQMAVCLGDTFFDEFGSVANCRGGCQEAAQAGPPPDEILCIMGCGYGVSCGDWLDCAYDCYSDLSDDDDTWL
jgi:hypothetical protein